MCDHFATVFPGSAPVNAGDWAADILATVDQDGGLALWDRHLSVTGGATDVMSRGDRFSPSPPATAGRATPCTTLTSSSLRCRRAISRQALCMANGGVKKCDRPGSSEYSLCRFSATWRASLSGMNGSLSLWNWTMRPAFALMASQRQGRA